MGDFNADVKEVSLHLLCNQYRSKSLNKDPTCYKNIDNPSCIDLLLTNSAKRFESTSTIETGLSNFHHSHKGPNWPFYAVMLGTKLY